MEDAKIYFHTVINKESHISLLEEKFLHKDMPTGDLDEIK